MRRMIFVGIVGLVGVVGIGGCKSVKCVPVERVRTEMRQQRDTVRVTDSVLTEKETVVREARAEDSALLARVGVQLRANERAILVLQRELEQERSKRHEVSADVTMKSDSIPVPYPVERELTLWEKGEMYSVGFVGCLVMVGAAGVALWIRRRHERC